MDRRSPDWEGYALTNVVIFVINREVERGFGNLAVVMARDKQGALSLPSSPLTVDRSRPEEAARAAIDKSIPQTQNNTWPNPFMWPTEARRQSSDNTVRLGYAAVAHLVDLPEDGSITLINPELLTEGGTMTVTDTDKVLIALGLESLRKRLDIYSRSTSADAIKKDTLPTLARLLRDPAAFTMPELQGVYYTVFAQQHPALPDRPLDPRNIARDTKRRLEIVPTGRYTTTGGRPAELLSLPAHILQGLGERPTKQ